MMEKPGDNEPPVHDRWRADAVILVKEDTGVDAIILVNHKYLEQNPKVMAWFDDIGVFVSISDKPEIIDTLQIGVSMDEVMEWVKLNKNLLLEYWNDDLYPTSKMLKEIKKL